MNNTSNSMLLRTVSHSALTLVLLLTAWAGSATAQKTRANTSTSTTTSTSSSYSYSTGDEKPATSKTFTVSKGGRLVVSLGGGNIRVVPTDKNDVSVNVYGDDEDDFEDLRMTQSENTVRVRNSASCGTCDIRYEISVPNQYDLDLTTQEGNIEIRDNYNGRITGRTSAGNIKMGSGTGTIDMNTSGGNIRIGNLKGDLSLGTSGGNLILGKIDGEADITTSGGDIRVDNVGKTLHAQTSGGDIHVGDVGGEASVTTSGGTIVIGKVGGKATLNTAGGDIEIASANGIVNAKTAGGNLDLDNITGSIIAKTAGGDIKAVLIPSGKGKSRLVTAAGEVRLYVPENAKATVIAKIRVTGMGWGRHSDEDEDEYKIHSDFSADKKERNEDDDIITATYLLNGGGEQITLETSNADIYIRKFGADGKPRLKYNDTKGPKGEKGDKGDKDQDDDN